MTQERFLQKLRGYWEWFWQGGHTRKHGIRVFRVLMVTKSEERMRNLIQASAKARDLQEEVRLFWFTSEKRIRPEQPTSVLEPMWETLDHIGSPQSILPSPMSRQTIVTCRGSPLIRPLCARWNPLMALL